MLLYPARVLDIRASVGVGVRLSKMRHLGCESIMDHSAEPAAAGAANLARVSLEPLSCLRFSLARSSFFSNGIICGFPSELGLDKIVESRKG